MRSKLSKIGRILLCIFSIFVASHQVHAQTDLFSMRDFSNLRIENLSDDDLRSLYEKAVSAGYTEDDVVKLATQRGLPSSELTVLRDRLDLLMQPAYRQTAKVKGQLPERREDSANGKIARSAVQHDQTIFGSELFTSASLAFEPNLRIPAPANYVLGPDDEIVISVYGYSENRYSLTVDEQGEIYIPNVGPILVTGLTLEEARDRIRNKLATTIYTAIRSGQTKVQVTLGKIRSIRVTVIGQATRPGNYTVSSLTTLYNLLYLCGGPTDMGSYRNIEVIGRGEKRTADLYDFLVYGNQKGNILLKEGDVVRIPYYDIRVTLEGLVKRPGKYELMQDETFSDLLKYSGGFKDNAYRGEVSVERVTDSVRTVIDLNAASFSSFQVKGSDVYFVKRLNDEFGNRLFISGAVYRPGPYELTPNTALRDLIDKAGGLTPDAYRSRALIYRYLPNKLPAIESVNLDSVYAHNLNIYLQRNDSVIVQSLFRFKDDEAVTVRGNVRNPTRLGWRAGMTLKDALFSAGGLDEAGDSTSIEVSRRITEAEVSSSNYLESEIFTVNLRDPFAPDIPLKPFDMIVVKEKAGYAVQRSVVVTGAVMSPGLYTLEKSETSITDIIRRIGGFKASADSNSLSIRRPKNKSITTEERERVFQQILFLDADSNNIARSTQTELNRDYDVIAVDLKRILANPRSPENLQLEDGDILVIERAANLVKVSGAVYFPTLVAYKANRNLKYYVEQAGNFMPKARKTGALVIQPNGKVASVKNFLFFKSYPPVTPRSEVFVPVKEQSNRAKLGATEWAVIVSALGILSNVVINLTR